jgi:hypothetical protein
MVWSATTIAAGVELDFIVTGDVLRKGIFKFALHLAPLDDCLYPEALLDDALPTSHCTELGVVSSVELVHDTGDSKWIMVRDRGRLRENGWAAKNKDYTVMISNYL